MAITLVEMNKRPAPSSGRVLQPEPTKTPRLSDNHTNPHFQHALECAKNVLIVYFSTLCPMAFRVHNRAWVNVIVHVLKQKPSVSDVMNAAMTTNPGLEPVRCSISRLIPVPIQLSVAGTFTERLCEVLTTLDSTPFCDDEAFAFYLAHVLRVGLEWLSEPQYRLLECEVGKLQAEQSRLISTAKDRHYQYLISKYKRTRFQYIGMKQMIIKLQAKGMAL